MNPFKKAYGLIKTHPVKRLAWATLYDLDTDCRCATGVMAFESGMKGAFDEMGCLTCRDGDHLDCVADAITEWAVTQGFTPVDLEIIERINDFFVDVTERQRYTRVLRVLRALGRYDETQVKKLRTAYGDGWRYPKRAERVITALIKKVSATLIKKVGA